MSSDQWKLKPFGPSLLVHTCAPYLLSPQHRAGLGEANWQCVHFCNHGNLGQMLMQGASHSPQLLSQPQGWIVGMPVFLHGRVIELKLLHTAPRASGWRMIPPNWKFPTEK